MVQACTSTVKWREREADDSSASPCGLLPPVKHDLRFLYFTVHSNKLYILRSTQRDALYVLGAPILEMVWHPCVA